MYANRDNEQTVCEGEVYFIKYPVQQETKKDIKLYNVLFPLWMLLLFPQMWLIVLPGNFIIDSLVFLLSMLALKIENKKQWYKKYIVKIFSFGLLADIIGSAYMLLMMLVFQLGTMGDEPYLTIPALIISAASIYGFHYYITFQEIDRKQRLALSLIFAVITAPYTFFVPSSWLY